MTAYRSYDEYFIFGIRSREKKGPVLGKISFVILKKYKYYNLQKQKFYFFVYLLLWSSIDI